MHHGEHTAAAAHCYGGSTHSFNLLDEKLSLSALMSVEAEAGLCYVTRSMKKPTELEDDF